MSIEKEINDAVDNYISVEDLNEVLSGHTGQ